MITVVAGLVVRDGRLLICGQDKPFYGGFKWEFPGGKIEHGESPEAALARELNEELGIVVRVGCVYEVVRHVYDEERDVLLLFYPCAIEAGEPMPLDGQAIEWVVADALLTYPFADADARVLARLRHEGLPQLKHRTSEADN